MRPAAVSNVRIGFSIEFYLMRFVENGLVEVGGCPAEPDAITSFNLGAVDISGGRADTPDLSQRRNDTNEFLSCGHDEFWILFQFLDRFGMQLATTTLTVLMPPFVFQSPQRRTFVVFANFPSK